MDANIMKSRCEACCTAEDSSLWLNCRSADIAVATLDTKSRDLVLLT